MISTINELNTNYIVDIETIDPINEIDYVPEELKFNNELILILSSNSIVIIKEPKEIKYIQTLCWDGLKNNRIENGVLKGQLYDWNNSDSGKKYNKTKYKLDLLTLILRQGKELEPKSLLIKKLKTEKPKNRKTENLKI